MPSPINCVTHDGSFFFMLRPDISRVGGIALDVVRGMRVTQSVRVGHIANFELIEIWRSLEGGVIFFLNN